VKKEREMAPSLCGKDFVKMIFKAWQSRRPTYPATWEGLFTVLRVQRIAKIVTGTEFKELPKPQEELINIGVIIYIAIYKYSLYIYIVFMS